MESFKDKFKKYFSGDNYGNFISYLRGEGLEISDFREYIPGDDVRSINWKLSAKFDKFYVNLYNKEKDITIYVYFDVNYNWNGYMNGAIKDKVYKIYNQLLSFASSYGAKIVCVYNYNNRLHYFNLGKKYYLGNAFLKNIDNSIKNSGRHYFSGISEFIDFQKKISKRRGIILFSDFLDISDYDNKFLKYFSNKNELILFKLNISDTLGLNYNFFNYNNKSYGLKGLHMYNI